MIWSAADLRALPSAPIEPLEVLYTFVSLEGEPSRSDEEVLDEEEIRRSWRFAHSIDRHRFILAHAALRGFLARCLGVEAGNIRYEHGGHGKPRLAADLPPLEFNLTHSQGLGLLAVARGHPVGVDVERWHEVPYALAIAEAHFSPAEGKALRALPAADVPGAFLRCWTRKEAMIKASGEGLGSALNSFEVDLSPGSTSALKRYASRSGNRVSWSLRDLPSPTGFVAAGAVAAPLSDRVRWRELPADNFSGARPSQIVDVLAMSGASERGVEGGTCEGVEL